MESQKLKNVWLGVGGLPLRAPNKPLTDPRLLFPRSSSNHHFSGRSGLLPFSNPVKPLLIDIDSVASSSRTPIAGRKRGLTGACMTAAHHASSSSSPSPSADNVSLALTINGQSNCGSDLSLRVGGRVPSPLGPTPAAAPSYEERRKLRRILSNRASAQRSRLKKLQYVVDLERKARTLELTIASITPQVEFYKNRMSLLLTEHKSLSHRLAACANKRLPIDAEIVEKKAELQRLQLVQLKQQHNALARQIVAAGQRAAGPKLEPPSPGPAQ